MTPEGDEPLAANRREQILAFMRERPYAVQASNGLEGSPQAAVVGVVVSDRFEVFFDTVGSSRKAQNLRRRPMAAFVFASTESDATRTVQLEGAADEPTGADRARLIGLYLDRFPDGLERQSWPGLTYFRITPHWIRYSDFSVDPPEIIEWDADEMRPTP
ncbi:MAG: pyridoxamine 5'-phosphate oxidase family protein [Candidatus Eisenbacteria bacterium]|uniref:Pyridoxamine 5'-phosphate oxidase family protein n=1 Tax=Eiseniibacteriota bacterium TaxID=2212470 RepID=A0A956M278_UNCEI|nr:pyridoxamine 5'-phosphate oxidase family protein [Candidatus Eisenbacteria bacterium]